MELEKLKEPFPAKDIEWRLQSCGSGSKGVWAICLAYVTNRAIMNRLDEVCGPENWKNEYTKGPDGGVLCGLSIKCNNEWITKWDGADNTAVEATKGGLSGAMKRAATQWGIGRYLYNLEEGFANILPDGSKEKGYYGKTKDGTKFKWQPPTLPDWALPKIDDKELQKEIVKLESYINDTEILTGDLLRKAKFYIQNKDLDGIKRTNEYCKNKASA